MGPATAEIFSYLPAGFEAVVYADTMGITVLGAGAWGTALAKVLSESGNTTTLWTWQNSHAEEMRSASENKQFLPGISLSENLLIESDLGRAASGAELVVVVVPSHVVRATMKSLRPHLAPGAELVCASKGIEADSLQLMTEVLIDTLSNPGTDAVRFAQRVAVLSGPSFAAEVAHGVPTNLVAASKNEDFSLRLQNIFSVGPLRVYTSDDPIGVEVGGALKNVIAVAAGACDGLGLGANTRAALITRGIAEIGRLAEALGGSSSTVSGLAGVGDLILTCTGDMSRNRTLGYKLGRGASLEEALSTSQGVAEGYLTAKSAHDLALRVGVDLPICEAVYSVLHGGEAPQSALHSLLSRPLRSER